MMIATVLRLSLMIFMPLMAASATDSLLRPVRRWPAKSRCCKSGYGKHSATPFDGGVVQPMP